MNNSSQDPSTNKLLKNAQDLWQKLLDSLKAANPLGKPDVEINPPGNGQGRRRNQLFLYLVLILSTLYLWQGYQEVRQDEIPYSEFLKYVKEQRIEDAVVTEQVITGTLKPAAGEERRRFITVPLWNQDLAKDLETKGVKYTVRYGGNWLGNFIFNWLLPIAILFALWSWMARRMTGAGRGFLSIGRNRVRINADVSAKVTFQDVAGAEEAKQELKETIEFLRDPSQIQRLGGRMPKGLLLRQLLRRGVDYSTNENPPLVE